MNASWLPRSFFERDALVVARALVGCRIVHGARVARIVETEAYRGPTDLACHARVGLTKRTRTLFGVPGHAYVFLIYGMHDCMNVVCKDDGSGHAVLLRAVEPTRGFVEDVRGDGPGRLAKIMQIARMHDGLDVCAGGALGFLPRDRRPKVGVSARVGVGYAGSWAEKPWRFFDAASPRVSKPAPRTIGLGRSR